MDTSCDVQVLLTSLFQHTTRTPCKELNLTVSPVAGQYIMHTEVGIVECVGLTEAAEADS